MKALLFASFGTSYAQAREQNIDSVAAHLAGQLDIPVSQAYTSGMVRRILSGRGIDIPSPAEALRQLAGQGVSHIAIQPGHLLPGEEYDKLLQEAQSMLPAFEAMSIGEPLLASTGDIHRAAGILADQYPAREGRCVILMGHGTPQFANTVYAAMDYRFKQAGRPDIYVGTVEAYPGLDEVLGMLPAGKYERVLLAPLMQVAGDHAINDMAGEEADSWASRLRAQGYEVEASLQGMGGMADIQGMYAEHALQALERLGE